MMVAVKASDHQESLLEEDATSGLLQTTPIQ